MRHLLVDLSKPRSLADVIVVKNSRQLTPHVAFGVDVDRERFEPKTSLQQSENAAQVVSELAPQTQVSDPPLHQLIVRHVENDFVGAESSTRRWLRSFTLCRAARWGSRGRILVAFWSLIKKYGK